MTASGTNSILMACKTYRDWGRDVKGITKPEMFVSLYYLELTLSMSVAQCRASLIHWFINFTEYILYRIISNSAHAAFEKVGDKYRETRPAYVVNSIWPQIKNMQTIVLALTRAAVCVSMSNGC